MIVASGGEINSSILEDIAKSAKSSITVRSKQAASEHKQLVQRVSFVRRLREEPQWRPVVHGVTKASCNRQLPFSCVLPADSQVLAASAVKRGRR